MSSQQPHGVFSANFDGQVSPQQTASLCVRLIKATFHDMQLSKRARYDDGVACWPDSDSNRTPAIQVDNQILKSTTRREKRIKCWRKSFHSFIPCVALLRWTDGRMDGRMGGQMDGWMDRQMDGWADGQVAGQME